MPGDRPRDRVHRRPGEVLTARFGEQVPHPAMRSAASPGVSSQISDTPGDLWRRTRTSPTLLSVSSAGFAPEVDAAGQFHASAQSARGGRRAWRRPAACSRLCCPLYLKCLNLNFRHERWRALLRDVCAHIGLQTSRNLSLCPNISILGSDIRDGTGRADGRDHGHRSAQHGKLVIVRLYGYPWVMGEYWPMITPCFAVPATDDDGEGDWTDIGLPGRTD
jgi:hypothetical protein